MLANYGQIVRRSAAVTAAVGTVMIIVGAAVSGSKGLVGAALGVALVAAFFAISVTAVSWAARRGPQAMMIAAIGVYVVKILALLFLVVRFANTTLFNPRMFGLAALACILAWTGAQVVWSMRLKSVYVEPAGDR